MHVNRPLKRMHLSPLILAILFAFGCKEEPTVVKEVPSITSDIGPTSYSPYYWFVDTLYRKYWEPMHQGVTVEVTPEMQDNMIIQLELWMSWPQTAGFFPHIRARAYTDLPPRLSTERYPDSVELSLGQHPGQKYAGHFVKLTAGEDYNFSFDGGRQMFGGYIVLNTNIPDDQALAVTYTVLGSGYPRSFGTIIGSSHDTTTDGCFLLKLIKPPGFVSNPGYKPAWELQLRNVYRLDSIYSVSGKLTIQILRRTETDDVEYINGEHLLRVLGLDRFDANLGPNPDGNFDFIPGLTVDVRRAELIFPTLRPFDSGIAGYFERIGKPLKDDSLLFRDLYDTTYTAAENNVLKDRYIIRSRWEARNP